MKNQLTRIQKLEQAVPGLDFSKMSNDELRAVVGDCAEFFATLRLEQLRALAAGQVIYLTPEQAALAPKHMLLRLLKRDGF